LKALYKNQFNDFKFNVKLEKIKVKSKKQLTIYNTYECTAKCWIKYSDFKMQKIIIDQYG